MLVPSPSMREFLETATTRYESNISGSEAERYLIDRGITKEALDSFRIGVIDNPLRGHEMYQGRISFPYITRSGVVSIRFRRPGDDPNHKKMLYVAGDQPRIYNTKALVGEKVFVCEGEVDTITAEICGYLSVGIPGATSWNQVFAPAFRYRQTTVVAHNDDSGEGMDLAKRIVGSLDEARIILCPKGHDLNSLYVSSGADAVKELLG